MDTPRSAPNVVVSPAVARTWSAAADALTASGLAVAIGEIPADTPDGPVLVTDVESALVPGGPLAGSPSAGRLRVVVLTPRGDVAGAVRALRGGAHEVVEAPPDPGQLVRAVRAALAGPDERPDAGPPPGALVGSSPAMVAVRSTLEAVAPVDANVLLIGESGTGKELAARAIHRGSPRSAGPFIAVNCAALPREILENELFGHERGAFTGALRRKPGCFELADGGTLFLDEIGEMETDVQAKLLRVIEQQVYRRLGGKADVVVDVRIIAATNRNIAAALEEGALRSDLYYRLSVVEILLPPLREREEDVFVLAHHFLDLFAARHRKRIPGFSPGALEAFRSYPWPGNVRELRNAVERAVLLSPEGAVEVAALPEKVRGARAAARDVIIPLGSSVEEAERRLILETLASVGNNKAKAARVLGVSRKTLHNKLNAFRRIRESDTPA